MTNVGPRDASMSKHVSFDSVGFEVELCESGVTVFVSVQMVPGVRSVRWSVDSSPPDVSMLRVTSDVPAIFAFLAVWFAGCP